MTDFLTADGALGAIEILWVTINSIALAFSVMMMIDRYLDWRTQVLAGTNGDRKALTKTALRRSCVRGLFNVVGLGLGVWLCWVRIYGDLGDWSTFADYFAYVLIAMVGLVLVNEIWDRIDRYKLVRGRYEHH